MPGRGGKKVFIRVFDEKKLVGPATGLSENETFSELNSFFNGLETTPQIEQRVADVLKEFSFEIIYERRAPTESEKQQFGMMDFPVYLESAEKPSGLTKSDAKKLLESHSMPGLTYTFLINKQGQLQHAAQDVYGSLEGLMNNGSTIGLGIPGNYLNNTQTLCRKIAIILIDRLMSDTHIAFSIRQKMFVAVLKHEIGHMLGLEHENGTLMHGNYQVSPLIQNNGYEPDHLKIIALALTELSKN